MTTLSTPPRGIGRFLLQTPIYLYRMGLGGLLNRFHIMILVTRGRISGLPRCTPVEYRQHGSKIYVISGWGDRAEWVRNLMVTPSVTVQQGGTALSACAEIVTNEGEALRALHLFRRRVPSIYDAIFARITRRADASELDLIEIARRVTIVRLVPQAAPSDLPPLPSDLSWIMPAAAVGLIACWSLAKIARRALRR
jgi:deazaflavin-dependent oxidoreductase (nitroreductase family)